MGVFSVISRRNFLYIGEGVLRSFSLTLGLILIYAVVSNFISVNANIRSLCLLVFSLLSVVYGAIYATGKIKEKGWIIGLIVASLYMLIFLAAAAIGGRTPVLSVNDVYKLLLAGLVGALSGMLGINL